jgi:hypothetical protein
LGTETRRVWGRPPIGVGAGVAHDRAIVRLLLFIRRPYHLSEGEADRWLGSQAASLVGTVAIKDLQVSRLRNPAARGGGDWDWLIEMHCDGVEEAERAAREDVCRDLVADLRLLGMNPSLVLADDTRPLED